MAIIISDYFEIQKGQETMKSFFRLIAFCLLVGGWALASASLYLVRSPGGKFEQIGKLALVPKDHLTYRDTYVDTRHWSSGDLEKHACVVARLNTLHRGDLLQHVSLSSSNDGSCSLCDGLPSRAAVTAQKKDADDTKPATIFEFPEKDKK